MIQKIIPVFLKAVYQNFYVLFIPSVLNSKIMKSIFFLLAMLICTALVFAQSSVTDVPAVKTVKAPAKVQQPAISSITTATPVIETKVIANTNSGSLAPVPVQIVNAKPLDNNGSVAPLAVPNLKPIAVKADLINSTNTSVELPAAGKKVEISLVPNSTNTAIPVQVNLQPVENTSARPAKRVGVVAKPLMPVSISQVNAAPLQQDLAAPTDLPVSKLPQTIINPVKPVQLETVPMTVINPAVKVVPVVPVKVVKPKNKE